MGLPAVEAPPDGRITGPAGLCGSVIRLPIAANASAERGGSTRAVCRLDDRHLGSDDAGRTTAPTRAWRPMDGWRGRAGRARRARGAGGV
ncbi:MAG TPA: hypothetical protein VGR62_01910, partial [Candidatus Binatia bacterium]|nr:hypothetical protein [Candidatus Binatia bacterium]